MEQEEILILIGIMVGLMRRSHLVNRHLLEVLLQKEM